MALVEVNRDPTPRQVRQFAVLWLPGFCFLMAIWSVYRFQSSGAALVLLACAIASITLGLTRPAWMRFVFIAWMWAAFPLGWILAHLMMAAIYFLVITPIGLAMRALGRDPLERQFDPRATTYWKPREQDIDPSRYFRQY